MKALKILFLLLTIPYCSYLGFAQTDYDISTFLDNRWNELPKESDLGFYLSAGRRLLAEGNLSDADVFFDFAACLGAQQGFEGKSRCCPQDRRRLYDALAKGISSGARTLVSALAHSKIDLRSALIVHDNLSTYCLDFLRDPLIEWMPSHHSDSTFLRANDGIAYLIAQVKEGAGNRLEAYLLYDLAAWEGNYESLQKAVVIGSDLERRKKEILIGRMAEKEDCVALHKYLAKEFLSFEDYLKIRHFMSTPSEGLVAYALGVSLGSYSSSYKLERILIPEVLSIVKLKRMSTESAIMAIRKNGYEQVIRGWLRKVGILTRAQENLIRNLISVERAIAMQDETKIYDYQYNLKFQLNFLKSFIKEHSRNGFSPKAIDYVARYFKMYPVPWSGDVLSLLESVTLNNEVEYNIRENVYYPLQERNLFSTVHFTQSYTPTIVDIKI